MQVPAFLLRRLYVRGSLRNVDGGFAFDLKNSLGAGYAEGVLPLTVDDEEVPVERARFVVDGESTPFGDVSPERTFTLAMNRAVTVAVDDRTLSEGKHKLGIGFIVTGMGKLRFDVTDVIDVANGEAPADGEDDDNAG